MKPSLHGQEIASAELPLAVISAALSKAEMLAALAGRLQAARLPQSVVVDLRQWQSDPMLCCARIQATLGPVALAVRSSRHGEDAPGGGNAGRYCSVIGVPASGMSTAIAAVFASYERPVAHDQVLLQPCIAPVSLALVAANRAPGDGAPYDAISRARGPSSSAITDGTVAAETLYVAHDSSAPVNALTARVLRLLREIEGLIGERPFELELALSGRTLWLLQLRLLTPLQAFSRQRVHRIRARAEAVRVRLRRQRDGQPPLLGLMPDWNPAELLGEHPRPLALDVFNRLIAHGTWWQARVALGYRRPRQDDLIVAVAGRPYVDVQASFESLLPSSLDASTAARVSARWANALRQQPALHDRVETSIALTCAEFDAVERLRVHAVAPADRKRMCAALGPLTQVMLDPQRIAARCAQLEGLARQQWASPITPVAAGQALCRLRLEVALPFAQAARIDFVLAALLQSAARVGAMEMHQLAALRGSARSSAGELIDALTAGDHAAMRERQQTLRPGTFEIAIPALSDWSATIARSTPARMAALPVVLTDAQRSALNRLLRAQSFHLDADSLTALVPVAARAREVGKLALSRGISSVLTGLIAWGARHGLDREMLGWLDLGSLIRSADKSSQESILRAQRAALRHAEDASLRMPALLCADESLSVVRCAENCPSFIGNAPASGAVHRVTRHCTPQSLPPGAVVAIESADPGFDWIFTRAPAALITAFGGPHSHMALRCGELGIAAALGLGLSRFRRFSQASFARIDPLRGALDLAEPMP